jgi:hypothetical protein
MHGLHLHTHQLNHLLESSAGHRGGRIQILKALGAPHGDRGLEEMPCAPFLVTGVRSKPADGIEALYTRRAYVGPQAPSFRVQSILR